eukprot:GHVN01091895.1.p1 GENE.GHVN01091895.1~~GHVN01091895.1.p1  ORF type:complete len:286 (+),score=24.71 GHVN01091895.1:119-976(+)
MDFINATSGGISAAAATGAIYPLDTLVVRYQAAISKRHGQQTVSGILAEALRQPNGVLGLYKGMSFKMVEQLIRNFVYFYWYNLFKRSWRKKFGPLSTSSNLFVATAAAAMNQCMTAPLEVISTNLQTTPMNVKQILRHVYEQEGIQGFYRGFGASLILCSNPAITSVAFDQLKALLQPPSSGESDIVFNKHASITSWQSFLLGAFAKALATAVTYPYIRSKVPGCVALSTLVSSFTSLSLPHLDMAPEHDRCWSKPMQESVGRVRLYLPKPISEDNVYRYVSPH